MPVAGQSEKGQEIQLVLAGVVYIVVNFAIAAIWNIVLFRAKYGAMTAGFQHEEPNFARGIAAMAINMALGLALAMVFSLGAA